MAKFIYSGQAKAILDNHISYWKDPDGHEEARVAELESVKALIQDLFEANGRMCRRLNKLEPDGPNEDART